MNSFFSADSGLGVFTLPELVLHPQLPSPIYLVQEQWEFDDEFFERIQVAEVDITNNGLYYTLTLPMAVEPMALLGGFELQEPNLDLMGGVIS